MTKSAQRLQNERVLRELEATLPPRLPTAHWPYVSGPEDMAALGGYRGPLIIGPYYALKPRTRQMLIELDALEEG